MKTFTFTRVLRRGGEKRKPCQVCCRFFARDRDLVLVDTDKGSYYICESWFGDFLGGDTPCNLAFPARPGKKIRVRSLGFRQETFILAIFYKMLY